MSIARRFNKLKKMSRQELASRAAEAARRWRERFAYGTRLRTPTGHAWNGTAAHLAARAARLVPGTQPEELACLQGAFPELYRALEERAVSGANRILDDQWIMLGHAVNLRGAVDWHADPRSGYRWPRSFYGAIPLYDLPDGVDVKYVWELSRHQFLPELARGWQFTRDDRFAIRARELLLDWIEHNPLYEGVNWTSALEVGVRAISWHWTLAGLAAWSGWKPGDLDRVTSSLVEHARYLRNHPSVYASPYNHLIGEATGLLLIGCWLHDAPEAQSWRRTARETLLAHAPRQFHEDGFCVEQATGYHFFTLGFLVQALLAAGRHGESLDELRPILARAFTAGAAFRQPDNLWPGVGDVDSARSIPVAPDDFWNFCSLLSLGAVIAECPELKSAAGQAGAELYWLYGAEGVRRFEELPAKCEPALTVLPDAGYAIARSDSGPRADWLMFDCGPIAHGLHSDGTPSTAHGHADALQVLYCHKGVPVLVDSGMPSYAGAIDQLDHFRGAAAHNVLEIEGRPVARPAGRLAWSHVCRDMKLQSQVVPGGWTLGGRIALEQGASITRHVLFLPEHGLWIADLVQLCGPWKARWCWQLPGTLRPELIETHPHKIVMRLGDEQFAVWAGSESIGAEIESAAEGNPAGWQSRGYGCVAPGHRVRLELACASEKLLVSYFGDQRLPAIVRVGGRSVVLSPDGQLQSFPASVVSDAPVVWHVRLRDGWKTFCQ